VALKNTNENKYKYHWQSSYHRIQTDSLISFKISKTGFNEYLILSEKSKLSCYIVILWQAREVGVNKAICSKTE
jgi:hypothetical protein